MCKCTSAVMSKEYSKDRRKASKAGAEGTNRRIIRRLEGLIM
jgi:hypothetical protein